MRKFLVAGNWKMHGTRVEVAELLGHLKAGVTSEQVAEMAVFPPFVFLQEAQQALVDSPIQWGAQNVAMEPKGAFTGEVSAAMLLEFGCRYVLVGHSERRALYGETDEVVAKKFVLAKQAGLTPVLCVGETLAEREAGRTEQVVKRQLNAVISQGIELFQDAVVAYEPVWAIGTGLTASSEQAQEVHAALRHQIAENAPDIARKIRILYGGSVKAASAQALFSMPDIDGGLVGGASLDAQEFLKIYQAAR